MILYPPERFDLNEWFSLFAAALPLAVALLLPRRFSAITVAVFAVFTVFLSQSIDSLIAVAPFDMYDVNDSGKYEVMDVVIYYFSYTPVGYIFMYFYDKWSPIGWLRAGYVGAWVILSVFLEWLANLCHVFTYKGWSLWYSPIAYLLAFIMFILAFHATEKLLKADEKA